MGTTEWIGIGLAAIFLAALVLSFFGYIGTVREKSKVDRVWELEKRVDELHKTVMGEKDKGQAGNGDKNDTDCPMG
jgi:hypothetical protein